MLAICAADNIRKIPSFLKLNQVCTKTCHGSELLSVSMTACSREHYEFDPLFFLLCNDPSEMRKQENGTTVLSKKILKHKVYSMLCACAILSSVVRPATVFSHVITYTSRFFFSDFLYNFSLKHFSF